MPVHGGDPGPRPAVAQAPSSALRACLSILPTPVSGICSSTTSWSGTLYAAPPPAPERRLHLAQGRRSARVDGHDDRAGPLPHDRVGQRDDRGRDDRGGESRCSSTSCAGTFSPPRLTLTARGPFERPHPPRRVRQRGQGGGLRGVGGRPWGPARFPVVPRPRRGGLPAAIRRSPRRHGRQAPSPRSCVTSLPPCVGV